jgi:hypothetical protein
MAIGTAAAILGSAAIGGIVSSRGASQAADAQTDASNRAVEAQTAAALRAEELQRFGVGRAVNAIGESTGRANNFLRDGMNQSRGLLMDGFGTARTTLDNSYDRAGDQIRTGMNASRGNINDAYRTQAGIYNPTIDSGLAASGARDYTLGIGDRPSDYQGFDQSEYFQSQLRNGVSAVDASAAAGGNLFSGATMRALQQSGNDLAYRSQGEYLGNLNSVSQQGQAAGQNLAGAAANRGTNLANINTSGRNALAGLAVDQGTYRANIATNQGNALAGLASSFGGDMANLAASAGTQYGNAWAGLGNNLSNVALGTGDAIANGAYGVGNAQAAGAIGQSNAFNGAIQNALGGWSMAQQMATPTPAATPQVRSAPTGGYSNSYYAGGGVY